MGNLSFSSIILIILMVFLLIEKLKGLWGTYREVPVF